MGWRVRAAKLPWPSRLIRGDARPFHDAGPARPVLGDQIGELRWGAAMREEALLLEKLPHVRFGKDRVQYLVVPADDRCRRAGRGEHPVPEIHVEIRDPKLRERRDVRGLRRAAL